MQQYLENNNEVLTMDNYNEIDGMIFSELSYAKFEDLKSDEMTISNYNSSIIEYKNEMSLSEYASFIIDNRTDLSEDQRNLYSVIANSKRYENCTVSNFSVETNEYSQWAAMTVNMDDKSSIIAYRGTDGDAVAWEEDGELLRTIYGTDAQRYSKEYLENNSSDKVILAGHSKGGNNAISAYAMTDDVNRLKVSRIDNFDGPGNNELFMQTYKKGYLQNENRKITHNFYPKDSLVGQLLGDNPGEKTFIDSSIREGYKNFGFVGEHDLYSFLVDENCELQQTNQSILSRVTDFLLDSAVENMNYQERYDLMELVERLLLPETITRDGLLYNKNGQSIRIDNFFIDGVLNCAFDGDQEQINQMKNSLEEAYTQGLGRIEEIGILIVKLLEDFALDRVFDLSNGLFIDDLINDVLDISGICEGINAFSFFSAVQEYVANVIFVDNTKVSEIVKSLTNTVIEIDNRVNDYLDGLIEFKDILNFKRNTISIIKPRARLNNTRGEFKVNLSILQQSENQLYKIYNDLENYKYQFERIYSDMSFTLKSELLFTYFKNINRFDKISTECKEMKNALENIENIYHNSERNIISHSN